MLDNKMVVLGAGGGPLTWVAVDVLRALQRAGAQVRVILSTETEAFVPGLTFQTLAGGEMVTADAMYGTMVGDQLRPLSAWVAAADAMVIVPATPVLVAKAAAGWADEALIRALLLHRGPTVLAYPGQAAVYQHPLVQQQLQRLHAAGMQLCDAGITELSGTTDELGWSLTTARIVEAVAQSLPQETPLRGKVVIITAGPTQEPIDPVRHISNRASGKTGFALAEAARQRGARVILVTGPTHLEAPSGVTCIRIQTALEMRQAVLEHYDAADVVIKTAAVADFRPKVVAQDKVKKDVAELSIPLERNPDILAELGQRKGQRVLVGFAAETQDLMANAAQKVRTKQLDFIVANDISDPSLGFASDANRVHILDAAGHIEELPTMAKVHIADYILDRVQRVITQRLGVSA
ncbi:MAG: bifunctional phosphopantothenoylcysteine decarboxylase/phosphopantothenate--cysteine ligase CoaBC [Candidatus Tectomicrobia bacterium]|uniref:Coenzyme A biosynthesis bifunctional protein CoaBC n=1 Tax=Tectimicrobiota bacterium TaxID=2528274 RepID=A0A937W4G8_UNCTE|nr:bifunctional phosphopantothenoylcysteine decarboxylase/phosphopantothenate--cysteine ligase CoaBC [Candidatus Tectomicrobia bacterium]